MNTEAQDFVTHYAGVVKWNYMTPQSCRLLEQELDELLENETPKAGSNAPRYELEGRIHEIMERLKTACVIDPEKRINRDSIGFGATVTYEQNGRQSTVTLVGCDEAALDEDKIDWDSDLAKSFVYPYYRDKTITILNIEYPDNPEKTKEFKSTDFSFMGYEDGIFSFNASLDDKIIILEFLRDISERLNKRFINIFDEHDKTIHHFIDHLHDQDNIEDGILTLHEQEFWYIIPYFRMVHDDIELRSIIPEDIVKTIFEALKEAEETIFIQLEKEQVTLKLKESSKEHTKFYATQRDIYIMAQFLRYARDADMYYYQGSVDVDIVTEILRKLEDKKIENGILCFSNTGEFDDIYSMYSVHKNHTGKRFDGTGCRRKLFLETLERIRPAARI